MAKPKWYAVTAGRDVGVFDNWLLVAPLVIKVSESVYRGYQTYEEANDAFEEARVAGLLKTIPKSKQSSSQATAVAHRETAVDPSPRSVRSHFASLPVPGEGSATRPTSDSCTKASNATSPPGSATLVEGSSPLRSPGSASPSKSQKQQTPPMTSPNPKLDVKTPGLSSDEEDMEIQVISHASTPRISARAKGKQREIQLPSPRPFETGGSISSPHRQPGKSPSPKAQSTTTSMRSRAKKAFPPERPGVTRRVSVQTPPGLASYPDDMPRPDEPPAQKDVLSPLSSPRLHTPAAMLSFDNASISTSSPRLRKAPLSDMTSVSAVMSSLGLASSVGRSPVVSSYSPERALDPRSPIARSAALPRTARTNGNGSSRPSPNFSVA